MAIGQLIQPVDQFSGTRRVFVYIFHVYGRVVDLFGNMII